MVVLNAWKLHLKQLPSVDQDDCTKEKVDLYGSLSIQNAVWSASQVLFSVSFAFPRASYYSIFIFMIIIAIACTVFC